MLNDKTIDAFKAHFRGKVIEPGDAAYDSARRVYNAMIDKRPAAIAYCVDEADVSAAVRFANERGLRIAVRGGGHNGGGLGSVDDGLVVDLSALDTRTDRARISSRLRLPSPGPAHFHCADWR